MNSADLFELIYNYDNLYYAWNKAKNVYFSESDFVVDFCALAEFEANLYQNIKKISLQIQNHTYRLHALTPLPLPKEPKEGSNTVVRQHFDIHIEDQIVWLAVINVIGPVLDDKMPYWSFGNRLYLPMWKESRKDDPTKKELKFGDYQASSRKIYRNWSTSWPLFKKAASITAKIMLAGNRDKDLLDDEDIQDINDYQAAPNCISIKTWGKNYWPQKDGPTVFYAIFDLKKFYPNVDVRKIFGDRVSDFLQIDVANKDSDDLYILLSSLTDFVLIPDCSEDLNCVEFWMEGDHTNTIFHGIPTGLFVAGFLANIAMIDIDATVTKHLIERRNFAHFRFVDDHVILAYSFDDLIHWIDEYQKILETSEQSKLKINGEKTEPEELVRYQNGTICKEDAESSCRVDPQIASPLTTLTLRKMSQISKSHIELLDESEKIELLQDIEQLLVTELPETEVRKDTRVSWAASLLRKLTPEIEFDLKKLYEKSHIYETRNHRKGKTSSIPPDELEKIEKSIIAAKSDLDECKEEAKSFERRLYQRIFAMILKSLKENVSKPKVWNRCIAFCAATGLDKTAVVLDMLKNESRISDYGKTYLFATLISSISNCIIQCIKTMETSESSEPEKNRAVLFIKSIEVKEISDRLNELAIKYHTYYMDSIMGYLKFVLYHYHSYNGAEIKQRTYTYNDFCYFWHLSAQLYRHYSLTQQNYLNQCFNASNIEKIELEIKQIEVISRIKLMYARSDSNEEAARGINSKEKNQINLADWIHMINEADCTNNEYSLLGSEWFTLMVVLEVIAMINKTENRLFNIKKHDEQPFFNCNPQNILVGTDFAKMCHIKNWHDFAHYFMEGNDHEKNFKIELINVSSDSRYDCLYFHNRNIIGYEKRQVFSLIVLLITLLSRDMTFSPLINRRDSIDRDYHMYIEKTSDSSISSYTRAIIVGALSTREFEKGTYCCFDLGNGRSEPTDQPLKIDTLRELETELRKAAQTLQAYQLSLENEVPRQLIPISLVNLSRNNNPY